MSHPHDVPHGDGSKARNTAAALRKSRFGEAHAELIDRIGRSLSGESFDAPDLITALAQSLERDAAATKTIIDVFCGRVPIESLAGHALAGAPVQCSEQPTDPNDEPYLGRS